MSNTQPTIMPPAEPIVSGNTTDFEICGNPNMLERVHTITHEDGVRTVTYGYVDTSTNTFVHSHQMEFKKGSPL